MSINDTVPLSQEELLEHEGTDLLWALESIADAIGKRSIVGVESTIELSPARAERIRWYLVGIRDDGKVERAEALLSSFHRHWPEHAGFLTELLVINVLIDPRPERVKALATRLWGADRLSSHSALLIAFDAVGAKNLETARHFWRHVDTDTENTGPFATLFRDAIAAIELADLSDGERLVGFLRQSQRYGDLQMGIRQAAFINRFALADPIAATGAALLAIEPTLAVEGLAHCMGFFSSTRQDAVYRQFQQRALSEGTAWSVPQFAKWSCLHAIRSGDMAGETDALAQHGRSIAETGGAAVAPFSFGAAQAEELALRRAAPSPRPDAPGPGSRRIFVGIFGQLRCYQATLPSLIEYARRDLAGDGAGHDLACGLATWDTVGGRRLSIHDGIGFFRELIPTELLPLLDGCGAENGSSLQRVLPHVTQTLIELSAEVTKSVTYDEVRAYLPAVDAVRVEDDDWFQDQVGQRLPETLTGAAMHYLRGNMNQLRMWSRIAALGQIMRDLEASSGRPFDHVVLLRSDLVLHHGSLSALVEDAEMQMSAVMSDFDPHAEYIEGVGDRYFVGSRHAIEPLFETFEHLLRRVRDGSSSLIRLNPHEGAGSILFSTGRYASPRTSIFYEIHRGRFSLDRLRDAVAADVRAADEGGMDARLRQLMPAA